MLGGYARARVLTTHRVVGMRKDTAMVHGTTMVGGMLMHAGHAHCQLLHQQRG